MGTLCASFTASGPTCALGLLQLCLKLSLSLIEHILWMTSVLQTLPDFILVEPYKLGVIHYLCGNQEQRIRNLQKEKKKRNEERRKEGREGGREEGENK